ncbi:MAG TPA: rod-binding protein [Alphaproteobacteria bacterium]|jgi:Rod binding domain-containing protein
MADLPTSALAAQAVVSAKAPDPKALRTANDAKRAAEEFEAQFLAQMLEHMFADVRTDGPFGGGQAEEIYRSLLMQEYGKVIAKAGGVGLADTVRREILRAQEVR